MALFYFHLRDEDVYEEDTTGVDLPDVDTARMEAMIAAREMLAEQIIFGIPIGNQVFEVCGPDHVMIFSVAFRDIFRS